MVRSFCQADSQIRLGDLVRFDFGVEFVDIGDPVSIFVRVGVIHVWVEPILLFVRYGHSIAIQVISIDCSRCVFFHRGVNGAATSPRDAGMAANRVELAVHAGDAEIAIAERGRASLPSITDWSFWMRMDASMPMHEDWDGIYSLSMPCSGVPLVF
jgi:hypothetical protein